MIIFVILVGTLCAGIGSVWVAAALSFGVLARYTQHMLSMAAGALLATAFMHLLPEAFESQAGAHDLFMTLLIGLVFFFLLDKAELWHHGHEHGAHAHGPAGQATAQTASAAHAHTGAHEHAHSHDHGHDHYSELHDDAIKGISLRLDKPINGDKITRWLDALLADQGPDILRAKGIIDVAGEEKRLVFQAVHMILEGELQRPWKPGEARYSRMVFIGRNLDEAALKAGFEACAA